MGITMLRVEVGNPASPDVTVGLQFLVDSGATYSAVPAAVLEGLGLRPLSEEEFRLADGTSIRRKIGGALFKYGDRIGVSNVIFGEEGDSTLLGVLTLEALGYALDPLRRELRPLPMLLGTIASGANA
jgi:clan AA aspartic protease